jgi:hypothetical protein
VYPDLNDAAELNQAPWKASLITAWGNDSRRRCECDDRVLNLYREQTP